MRIWRPCNEYNAMRRADPFRRCRPLTECHIILTRFATPGNQQVMTMSEKQAGQGRVELICGCMFSGKSEYLIRRATEAQKEGMTVAAFKHAADDRYSTNLIVSHSGLKLEAIAVKAASRISELVGQARIVIIDEAQFFENDLADLCRQLARRGCDVIVAGLDRDSWGLPFGPMPRIEHVADLVTRTTTFCSCCGAKAEYTQRLAPIDDQRMIGGSESYEPRCSRCFKAPSAELRR